MTAGEQQIARFILDNPGRVCQLTSSELALTIGASQSSIVKFSKKLGFTGFLQLKLAINETVAKRDSDQSGMIHGTIQATDSLREVSLKLLGGKLHCLQETLSLNNAETLEQAVAVLNRARRIHLAGVGSSSLVARDFSYKLLKLGRMVLHDSDSHIQIANAATLSAQDVLLAFSHSGTSSETFHITSVAKARHAYIITVTKPTENPVASLADLRLYTVADEEKARLSSITVRDTQLLLIDLLFILMTQQQSDANNYVHDSMAAVARLKL